MPLHPRSLVYSNTYINWNEGSRRYWVYASRRTALTSRCVRWTAAELSPWRTCPWGWRAAWARGWASARPTAGPAGRPAGPAAPAGAPAAPAAPPAPRRRGSPASRTCRLCDASVGKKPRTYLIKWFLIHDMQNRSRSFFKNDRRFQKTFTFIDAYLRVEMQWRPRHRHPSSVRQQWWRIWRERPWPAWRRYAPRSCLQIGDFK